MIEKLRINISRIFVLMLFGLLCVSGSFWEDRLHPLTTFFFVLGTVLAGMASMGRLWCSLYIAGYKTKRLITLGPYSICRNPLYFFSFLGALGVGLATETMLIPLLLLVAFVCYYPLVIRSEEERLRDLHKEEYESYLREVPCFFPNIALLKEPEEYQVKPIVFKDHMFDALWFIWFLGIMKIFEELHKLDILPILFRIY